MIHEAAWALIAFGAGASLAALLLWPRRGVLARLLAWRTAERTAVEDALKYLYNGAATGRSVGVESLAGALEQPQARVVGLLARMEEGGLVHSTGAGVELSEAGRTYALEVLRRHRLWERYLAERTGVAPGDWHAEADRREHTLSAAEVAALSAELGHPRYDPHGDPIPGTDGRMPPAPWVSLTSLAVGEEGVVAHLEDEPREVYARLVAAGLGPGTRLTVLAPEPGRVRIRAAGREQSLERVVASSIEVERVAAGSGAEVGLETLAALETGEGADVVRLSPACRGPQRRRLLDLGVVPGTRITARLRSAAGDPVAYDIRGALIALRREQAEWILVQRPGVEEGMREGA